MSFSVRVLGPVELWADGAGVSLGPAKRRALLAALAL
jgi:DNA-binding SARP family transcriptional activator